MLVLKYQTQDQRLVKQSSPFLGEDSSSHLAYESFPSGPESIICCPGGAGEYFEAGMHAEKGQVAPRKWPVTAWWIDTRQEPLKNPVEMTSL